MEPNIEQQRLDAHALLDMVPGEKLQAVRDLLQVFVEPLSHSLTRVPIEDEELSSEGIAAIEEGRRSLARGERIPHDEILREFGLL